MLNSGNPSIKDFAIVGERCSGTNFLRSAIEENFYLKNTERHGHKHFFGHTKWPQSNTTLFVGTVRHPLDWLNSFWRKPHHLKKPNKKSPRAFLNKAIHSYHNKPGRPEIRKDWNMKTGRPYKNVFQLRKIKARYLLDKMPTLVKHYIFIRYEDLKNSYDETLERIRTTFGLTKKSEGPTYKPIVFYKGLKRKGKFNPNKRQPNAFTMKKIQGRLCNALEKRLGYL